MQTTRKYIYIYMSFNAMHSEEIDTNSKLCACVSVVKKWRTDNLLQLNTDKTKF